MTNNTLLESIIRIHDASELLSNEFVELVKEQAIDDDFAFKEDYEMTKAEYLLPANQEMLARIRDRVAG